MTLHTDSTLTINLDAITANYRHLQQQLRSGARCTAVVKANAYGLGVAPVAKALFAAGCRHFFVAHLQEGIELRSVLKDAPIYVFHGIAPGTEATFLDHHLTPVLNDAGQIDLWQSAAQAGNHKLPAVLHIDTGMNRLGVSVDEAMHLLDDHAKTGGIDWQFFMSHLACAHDPEHFLNLRQLHRFKKLESLFPQVKRCFANSSGIFLGQDFHFDMARPGAALYGVNPLPEGKANPMQHVATVHANILQVNHLKKNDTVGYGATCELKEGSRIATLAIGYADGYFRLLSNKAYCYIADCMVPVVGRVSMDLVTIDVTKVPESHIFPGAKVEMIGEHYTVDDAAKDSGTIGYEILTSLGHRYKRIYLGGNAA